MLPRMIMVFVGLVVAATASAGAFERWMVAREISAAFAGRTIAGYYVDGDTFTEIYGSDGRIDYRETARHLTGKWSVVANTFCTIYDTSPTGGCFRVHQASANCFEFYFIARDEREAAAPDPKRPSWTARGWRKDLPSTCVQAPSV